MMDYERPIGLSPHFSIHVVGDNQVLLLSEQRSFRLTGKLYVAMIPYLDGTRTGTGVIEAFKGRAPEERLRGALENLTEKGYAAYVDGKAPSGRQALWSELGMVPADAERNLARLSLAVKAIPGDAVAAGAARMLRRAAADAGIAVVPEKSADLTVVCVQDYLNRRLEKLNRSMRKAGRSWLLFKAAGSMPLLGPAFRPDAAPCWACLSNRMLENRPGDRLVGDGVEAARPARAHSRATLGLAANLAAVELVRAIAQGGFSPLGDRIVSFDVKTRAHGEHLIRTDPACAVCGERHDAEAALAKAMTPLTLRAQPIEPQVDGGWRVASAADVVNRLERYVGPVTGIIAGLKDDSLKDGLPVFSAMQTNPVQTNPRANRLVGRPSAAAGKGMGKEQAKASCLAEAMERYLCGFTGREPRKRAAWPELGQAAPHPNTYLNYSERQYDTRESWNKDHSGFNWVGERFDERREIEWTPAWSLTHGARRWLPTRYCYFGYVDTAAAADSEENKFCSADSNGCASGSTVEEAILQGFLELVERDACALWWYNRVRRPAFDLETSADPFSRRVQAYCASRGRDLCVLDLTNDFGIPVAIALSHKKTDGKSIILGLGAHLDADMAINRALAEMNQMMAVELSMAEAGERSNPGKTTGDDAVMDDWLKNKSLATEPYCVPDGTIATNAYRKPRIGDLKEAVEICMRAVSDRGYEMIVFDHSRPEIDFAAARVVVPGMRHFWARLREGRLTRAPVEMGWLGAPLAEADLNPIPFFL